MSAAEIRRRGGQGSAAGPAGSASTGTFLAVPPPDAPSESEVSIAPSDAKHPSISSVDANKDAETSTFKVAHQHRHEVKPKTRKRRNTFIFLLGSLFGLVAAGFFAQSNDLIYLPEIGELSMESIFEVLPAGFVSDIRDLVNGEKDFVDNFDSFSAGLKAKNEGLEAHHSVVLVPGVISTGLESWGTGNMSRQYFRKRLWGSWSMMRALVLDQENWKQHIMLDKRTGLDPPNGIKLRAAQGFDATDFFITGYWIWNKILENLASLGYDPTNSFTAAYDWRLSCPNLEVRDQYFTRLKSYIETAHTVAGRKVVLTSHSMGSLVLFYFFHWVASPMGGNGGDDWVDRHVEAWINISGCMLGAAKDVTAVLSGEMRDTAQLNAFAVYGLEKFLSKEERAELFRSMPGLSSMLPMGGEAVWGNLTWAPDDLPGQSFTYGSFLNFRPSVAGGNNTLAAPKNLTVTGALEYLFKTTDPWYRDMVRSTYSHGVAKTAVEVAQNEEDPRKWVNPLETRLPLAPNLKIYCFYGVGKPTERSYYYRPSEQQSSQQTTMISTKPAACATATKSLINITMDTTHTAGEADHGVLLGEGDGTVNILSTGYMCNKGWKMRRYNPAGVKITVVEMPHEPDKFNMRGGPNTADHVDILGRKNLNELVLRVVAGRGEDIEDFVVSGIREYADRVKVYEEG